MILVTGDAVMYVNIMNHWRYVRSTLSRSDAILWALDHQLLNKNLDIIEIDLEQSKTRGKQMSVQAKDRLKRQSPMQTYKTSTLQFLQTMKGSPSQTQLLQPTIQRSHNKRTYEQINRKLISLYSKNLCVLINKERPNSINAKYMMLNSLNIHEVNNCSVLCKLVPQPEYIVVVHPMNDPDVSIRRAVVVSENNAKLIIGRKNLECALDVIQRETIVSVSIGNLNTHVFKVFRDNLKNANRIILNDMKASIFDETGSFLEDCVDMDDFEKRITLYVPLKIQSTINTLLEASIIQIEKFIAHENVEFPLPSRHSSDVMVMTSGGVVRDILTRAGRKHYVIYANEQHSYYDMLNTLEQCGTVIKLDEYPIFRKEFLCAWGCVTFQVAEEVDEVLKQPEGIILILENEHTNYDIETTVRYELCTDMKIGLKIVAPKCPCRTKLKVKNVEYMPRIMDALKLTTFSAKQSSVNTISLQNIPIHYSSTQIMTDLEKQFSTSHVNLIDDKTTRIKDFHENLLLCKSKVLKLLVKHIGTSQLKIYPQLTSSTDSLLCINIIVPNHRVYSSIESLFSDFINMDVINTEKPSISVVLYRRLFKLFLQPLRALSDTGTQVILSSERKHADYIHLRYEASNIASLTNLITHLEKLFRPLEELIAETHLRTNASFLDVLSDRFDCFVDISNDRCLIYGSITNKRFVRNILKTFINTKTIQYISLNELTSKEKMNVNRDVNHLNSYCNDGKIHLIYWSKSNVIILLCRNDFSINEKYHVINKIGKHLVIDFVEDRPRILKEVPKECPVCLCDVDAQYYTLTACKHTYCRSCIRENVQTSVKNTLFPIVCTEEKCGTEVSMRDILTFTKGNTKKQLVKFAFEKYASDNDINVCKDTKCSGICRPLQLTNKNLIRCSMCGKNHCPECRALNHPRLTCDQAAQNIFDIEEWMAGDELNRKRCPVCKIGIQKNDGCNQMMCLNCKTYMCWKCMIPAKTSNAIYTHMTAEKHF